MVVTQPFGATELANAAVKQLAINIECLVRSLKYETFGAVCGKISNQGIEARVPLAATRMRCPVIDGDNWVQCRNPVQDLFALAVAFTVKMRAMLPG